MIHFGILCLGATGHLNTMFPLGHELQQRGHRITIFSLPNVQPKAQAAGFNFCDIYATVDTRSASRQPTQTKKFVTITGINRTFRNFAQYAETRLQNAAMIREQGIETLLVDLSVFEGGTIAEYLNIPYTNLI